MTVRNLLVISTDPGVAAELVAQLSTTRIGFGAPHVVTPDAVEVALGHGPWDVVLFVLPLADIDLTHLLARTTAVHPEVLAFALSSSSGETLDGEVLAGLAAGARSVLPTRQVAALGVLIERAALEREATRAVQRQNQRILAAAGEGIYGLDLEGRTTFVNPAAAQMIDWPLDELIGKPQHAILHHTRADGSPYPRELCPIYAALRDGAVHHIDDEVFWRKDGTSFPVEYVSTPMVEAGRVVGAVVVFRDISRRRALERQLAENLHDLETTQASLTSALEALLATEELTLAGQRMGIVARELHAAVARLRASALADVALARDLSSLEATLAAIDHLSSEPAPPASAAVDVGQIVADALRTSTRSDVTAGTPVHAPAAAADLREIVHLLAAVAGEDATFTVTNDEGVPTLACTGRDRARTGAETLNYLLARRLAGRNAGSIESRHEPGNRVTYLVRLPPVTPAP